MLFVKAAASLFGIPEGSKGLGVPFICRLFLTIELFQLGKQAQDDPALSQIFHPLNCGQFVRASAQRAEETLRVTLLGATAIPKLAITSTR